MLELARLLPDEHDINSVVDADREDEAKGKDIEQVQMDLQKFHRCDHGADGKREGDDLNDPETQIAIQNREQRDIEDSHERADDEELPV